jgi:two-component system, LytTR family, response regulator
MSTELTALIVDDEPVARDLLRSMLAIVEGGSRIRVLAECRDVPEAIEAIREHAPDVVFLDVEMPGGDGFGVIEAIGAASMPAVVFVTAYDHYAIRAFEVLATDYLLKPFDEQRLESTLSRLASRLGEPDAGAERRILRLLEELRTHRPYASRLAVEVGDHRIFVPTGRIDWIEAKGKHALVHAGENTYVIREGLTAVTERLDPAEFIRIHRSCTVRIDRIREVHRWFRGDYHFVLADGTKLTSGATYKRGIEETLLDG